MNKGRLTRTSVFLGQDQLEQLRRISDESGVPLAVMVRRGIGLFLDAASRRPAPRWGPGVAGPAPDIAGPAAISPAAEPGTS